MTTTTTHTENLTVPVSASKLVDIPARQERGRQVSQGKLAAKIAAAPQFGYVLADWERVEAEVRLLSLKEIMSATGLAITQASKIKSGRTLPHPRHWSSLIGAGRQRSDNPSADCSSAVG